MKTVGSMPFLKDNMSKHSNYEQYIDGTASGKKTQRYARLVSPKIKKKLKETQEYTFMLTL